MGKASEHLAALVARCESTDPDEAVTWETPLSVEQEGRYLDVLFTTGGPHFEVQLDFGHGAGLYLEEGEPIDGLAHYAGWGEQDWCWVTGDEARTIAAAILRDPDELTDEV